MGVHRNDDLTELDGPTEIWPGTFGGVITPPAAADGVVYVATLNAPTTLAPDAPSYIGSEIGTALGEITAVDAVTGTCCGPPKSMVIRSEAPPSSAISCSPPRSRSGSTLSHADTGEVVWTYEAPGGINGWRPSRTT